MHITELRIRNFRNFLSARLRFHPGVNTLIGENGSGKTNVLHALRLLLDEALTRNAVYLRESDFCRELGSWQGQWIVIAADFSQLDSSEGCQLLRHTTAHMDSTETGTFTFFFRPKAEVRKRLHELASEGGEFATYLGALTVYDYEPVLTGRARGDFLDDNVYRRWAGDFKTGTFPNPEDDDQDILGVKIPSIHQEVACTFVPALRDVVAELRAYRGNPLLSLLRGMESTIEIADSQRIVRKVADLNADISSLDEIRDLAVGVETALQNAVGYTYAPGVTIESALPDSMEKLLQRLCVLVGDSASSAHRGELHEQSLGGANLIFLALKLLEYETKLSSDRVAHFLLIEEPESHIHTHVQKALFKNLPCTSTQVFVSTHSTHISSASRITSVNVFAKKGNHAEVFQPSYGLAEPVVVRVERYLDAVRSTLLFAKGVLLVEGDSEQVMIPALLRAVFGVTPDELGFSVVAMDSAFFGHVAVIFAADRIRRPCAIVTDFDAALIELPDNPENDNPAEAHARAAEAAGLNRLKDLSALAEDNPWVDIFTANHTFEIDFVGAGNAWEVTQILGEIYIQRAAQVRSENTLNSSNLSESGQEILRLAERIGKGWFALLLAEKLVPETCIPEYILRAIAFACHLSVPDTALKQMGLFRISHVQDAIAEDHEYKIELPSMDEVRELTPVEFLTAFRRDAPIDPLSLFCMYLEEYRGNDPA